jgi:hypothetical protein
LTRNQALFDRLPKALARRLEEGCAQTHETCSSSSVTSIFEDPFDTFDGVSSNWTTGNDMDSGRHIIAASISTHSRLGGSISPESDLLSAGKSSIIASGTIGNQSLRQKDDRFSPEESQKIRFTDFGAVQSTPICSTVDFHHRALTPALTSSYRCEGATTSAETRTGAPNDALFCDFGINTSIADLCTSHVENACSPQSDVNNVFNGSNPRYQQPALGYHGGGNNFIQLYDEPDINLDQFFQ